MRACHDARIRKAFHSYHPAYMAVIAALCPAHNPLRNKAFIDNQQMNTVKFNKKKKAL